MSSPPTSGRPTTGKAGVTAPRKPKKAFANGLVALSSAAVIAVYAAGYARTESAAGQMQAVAAILPTATTGVTPTVAPTATATTAPTSTTQPAPAAGNTGGAATGQRTGRQRPGETQPGASTAPVAPNAPATSSAPAASSTPAASSAPIAPSVPTATATTTIAATTAAFKDGTYLGTGTSRHGNIGVTVTVQGGAITSAEITDCGTRYPCSRIANLPAQAVARQSAAVDLVSGATDSTNAYRAAVNAALAQAR